MSGLLLRILSISNISVERDSSVQICSLQTAFKCLQIAEVGTSANRSANPQIADSSFHLRICSEKLKFTANPQSNRQCCLIRGKTAWKKWTLLFSGLEVNVRELMTFFFLWWLTSGRWQNLTFKNKKGHHEDKITVNNVV